MTFQDLVTVTYHPADNKWKRERQDTKIVASPVLKRLKTRNGIEIPNVNYKILKSSRRDLRVYHLLGGWNPFFSSNINLSTRFNF